MGWSHLTHTTAEESLQIAQLQSVWKVSCDEKSEGRPNHDFLHMHHEAFEKEKRDREFEELKHRDQKWLSIYYQLGPSFTRSTPLPPCHHVFPADSFPGGS